MVKKRGLGRGLDALLGSAQPEQDDIAGAVDSSATAVPASLPVDLIQRGRYQPRRNFDEDKLRELADSINAQGMVQPIVVRPVGDKNTRSSPASAAGGPLSWPISPMCRS